MTDTKGRKFELILEIDAPPQEVWKALTEADEIARWFAPEARVTPGTGGSISLSWGESWLWTTDIAVWEPPRRLRVVDRNARPYDIDGKPVTASPAEVAIDYFLEGRGGKTILRLVHSGFGEGASWDDELEGISSGWPAELRNLRHYLEHHRGTTRRYVWARGVTEEPVLEAWKKLVNTVAPAGAIDGLAEGDRYRADLATGDRFEGDVMLAMPPGRSGVFSGTVESWNDGVFRLWVDRVGGQSSANVWLSAWGMEPEKMEAFRERLTPLVRTAFPSDGNEAPPEESAKSKASAAAPSQTG